MITSKELSALREQFPEGARVRLIHMDDPYRPDLMAGTEGVVTGVDDAGTIHVRWDCSSSLGIVYGVDKCERI